MQPPQQPYALPYESQVWKSEGTFLVLTSLQLFQVWSVVAVNTPSTPTFALNLCCFWNFSLISMLQVTNQQDQTLGC